MKFPIIFDSEWRFDNEQIRQHITKQLFSSGFLKELPAELENEYEALHDVLQEATFELFCETLYLQLDCLLDIVCSFPFVCFSFNAETETQLIAR